MTQITLRTTKRLARAIIEVLDEYLKNAGIMPQLEKEYQDLRKQVLRK